MRPPSLTGAGKSPSLRTARSVPSDTPKNEQKLVQQTQVRYFTEVAVINDSSIAATHTKNVPAAMWASGRHLVNVIFDKGNFLDHRSRPEFTQKDSMPALCKPYKVRERFKHKLNEVSTAPNAGLPTMRF